jgi:hypothetical protein
MTGRTMKALASDVPAFRGMKMLFEVVVRGWA